MPPRDYPFDRWKTRPVAKECGKPIPFYLVREKKEQRYFINAILDYAYVLIECVVRSRYFKRKLRPRRGVGLGGCRDWRQNRKRCDPD